MAFIQGDKHRVKELEKEHKTKLARLHHKNKVEEKFITGNAREAWQGFNTMMGRAQKPTQIQCSDHASFAEQFNFFMPGSTGLTARMTGSPPTPVSS
ncbi:hypothetical protein AAFF_G00364370 [Aldrovandia affinis]|uniref:Uncharacterized protein n=1 Tax=Aldrovandia affinis TaxID=143900 RepID=A0AAD7WN31_9TELE|nr:hypothetical protein AAFF_G00364370 [Aldrovandia affinis]